MATTQDQTTSIRDAPAVEPGTKINPNRAVGAKTPKRVGMCGFYREDQFPNGLYSFSENLMRGMAALRGLSQNSCPFELTVFHSPHGLRWTDPQLNYRELPRRRGGRFTAETIVGFSESAGLDAILFP